MNRWNCIAVAALVVIAPAWADAPGKKVPFEIIKSKHIVVNVMVNGKGPYRLIFDTGAPTTLINNKVAKEAGLIDNKTKKPPIALFGTMGQFFAKSMELGDAKAENVAVTVADHPTVEAISKLFGPIEGIVGYSFFGNFHMTIDYQAQELTFAPGKHKVEDVMQAMMNTIMGKMNDRQKTVVLSAPALWGFHADKDGSDDEAGLVVRSVAKGGAAEAAGLQVNDRVLTIDGRWTDSVSELYDVVSRIKAGASVLVGVQRGSQELKLKLAPRAGY